jgi:superfamily II DNA/RNA helicase
VCSFYVCAVISVIPTIARLKAPSTAGIRALLLAPTRELAEQIHREVLRLVEGRRFKVCLLSKKISGKAIASQVRLCFLQRISRLAVESVVMRVLSL